jgi:NAD(P)-dependent dehydrogenase (short-subunit alcohol dehydrogenase family)
MEQTFSGKTVLVTGAGWGIGAATALLYAAYGAKVIVSDTSQKGGKDTVTKINSQHGTATYIKTDVSNTAACEQLIKTTIETYGSIDIACNNSAIFSEPLYRADINREAFDKEVDLNLNSLHNCMQYEIEAMVKQGGGIIVNTASILGAIGFASLSEFVEAKYGMAALQQDIQGEYPARGIYINTIAPTFINTALLHATNPTEEGSRAELSSLGRIGMAQEVASLVLWLSSAETHLFPTVFKNDN